MADVRKGDAVHYRLFNGDLWDAVITDVNPLPGYVDIEVTGPGLKEPFHLRAIRWSDDPTDPRPGARPKPVTE